MSKKVLTLLIIQKDGKVLLGMKKHGFGMGKWNGFGGKVEEGESIEAAAKREVSEEAGISVEHIQQLGVVEFSWQGDTVISVESFGAESKSLEVHIFKATDFSGEPKETQEMKPQWFGINEIPYENMWADDKFWFPLVLENKKFNGKFIFDDHNNVVDHQLQEIS